jgi:hypothetical protein
MEDRRGSLACCCDCGGPDAARRVARRQRYQEAVFGRQEPGLAAGALARLPAVVHGTVLDVSPHVITVGRTGAVHRLALSAQAMAWRGTLVEPAALRTGERIVARLAPGRRDVVDRMWAGIGRVTGIVLESAATSLVVDGGALKHRQQVTIAPSAQARIRVRFPWLGPGTLVDLIGLRHGAELEALIPATAQPAYLAHQVNRVPERAVPASGTVRGSATWHEPADPDSDAEGVAYPAIDPGGDCGQGTAAGHGDRVMPYLSLGSALLVRNECTGAARVLRVTCCGANARRFNDRCLTCGTSPRGRVADLGMASFVALGGDLADGCFNATVTTTGRRP